MMSKRIGTITLILTLLSLVIPSQVNAAVKVGGNCAKVGLTAKAAGKNLTCTKSQWKATMEDSFCRTHISILKLLPS